MSSCGPDADTGSPSVHAPPLDADGDGWVSCASYADTDLEAACVDALEGVDEDCDDADPSIHPEAAETPYDGVDQDCDGADITDADGDGYDAAAVPDGTD